MKNKIFTLEDKEIIHMKEITEQFYCTTKRKVIELSGLTLRADKTYIHTPIIGAELIYIPTVSQMHEMITEDIYNLWLDCEELESIKDYLETFRAYDFDVLEGGRRKEEKELNDLEQERQDGI